MQTDKQSSNPKQKEGPTPSPLPNSAGAYARRFIEFYGKHVRYCRKLGGFLTWNGRHWTPDETGQVWRWIIRTASQGLPHRLHQRFRSGVLAPQQMGRTR